MRGSEKIIDVLTSNNVTTIFGVPGVNVLSIFDACQKDKKCNIVTCKNESGAAYMADGYARINGLGCCVGTTGPGISNMLTGVMGSYYDSIPVIAISAQVEENEIGKYGIQEMSGIGRTPDMMAIMEKVTKKTYKVRFTSEIEKTFSEACKLAVEGRKGPVYIELSPSALLGEVEQWHHFDDECSTDKEYTCDESDLKRIVSAAKNSKMPVMLIGNGCSKSDTEHIWKIARKLNIPVVSTALGKKLFINNEKYLGCIGCYGNFRANRYFEQSDYILAIGTCFSYLTTSGWSFDIENKFLVRVDIDQEEINRNYIPDIAVEIDARSFLKQLAIFISHQSFLTIKERSICLEPDELFEEYLKINNPIEYIKILNNHSKLDVYYVLDVGQNAYWSERYINVKRINGFHMHGGMGAMGYGVAASIGIAEAVKKIEINAKVVCICGDGGFLMNGLELNTARNENSNVLWIVFENNTLGTQQAWAGDNGMEYDCHITDVNIVDCAKSMGIDAYKVNNTEDFEIRLNEAMDRAGPILISVAVDENIRPSSFYCDGADNINR